MNIRGYELTYPRILLVALVVVLVSTGIVGFSTSSTAFGSYNPSWDGTSDLRGLATNSAAETEIGQNTTVYEEQTPAETTVFILSPTEPYTDADIDRISAFLEHGGTIVLAADFTPRTNTLLQRLNVSARFDGRLVRDERNYHRSPDLPVATNIVTTPRMENVSQLTLNHGTVLSPGTNSTILANTSGYAYLDANRNGQLDETETLEARPVVIREPVGDGQLILVSDPSIFINAMLDQPDNQQFAQNLINREATIIFDYSHRGGIPTAVAVVLAIKNSPLLQFVLIGILSGLCGGVWILGRGDLDSPWSETTHSSPTPELSQSELTDRVTARHPEWDDDRIERVASGIMPAESNETEND